MPVRLTQKLTKVTIGREIRVGNFAKISVTSPRERRHTENEDGMSR